MTVVDQFCVFPVRPRDKRPMVPWTKESRPRHEWNGSWIEGANVGIDCGCSGLVVIDEDEPGAVHDWLGVELPPTYTVTTGKGRHLYFLAPDDGDEDIGNRIRVAPGVDVRGAGGYVVGAGSVHPSGAVYEVEVDMAPAPLPPVLLDKLTTTTPSPHRASTMIELDLTSYRERLDLPEVIREGHRQESMFKYACSLVSRRLRDEEAFVLLHDAYGRCDPPWTPKEDGYESPAVLWRRANVRYGAEPTTETAVRERLERLRINAEAERLFEEQKAEAFTEALRTGGDPGRFTVLTPDQIREQAPMADIVAGVIGPPGTLNELDGHRGSMKSMTTLGIAAAVGGGYDEVYGLEASMSGPVLYAYLEGAAGLSRRLRAWEAHHGELMAGVHFLHDPFDMKRPEDVRDLAGLARQVGAVLVVLDSVAKTGGGKEDVEDFGQYRRGIESLRDATGAAVLVLHNSGHDQSRGRGHSTLADGMDSVVLLKKTADDGVVLSDLKNRDSAALENVRLRYEPCGPVNPATGEPWSGVVVRQGVGEVLADALRAAHEFEARVLAAIDTAGGSIKRVPLADALGLLPNHLARELKPLIDQEVIVREGTTSSVRYRRPRNE